MLGQWEQRTVSGRTSNKTRSNFQKNKRSNLQKNKVKPLKEEKVKHQSKQGQTLKRIRLKITRTPRWERSQKSQNGNGQQKEGGSIMQSAGFEGFLLSTFKVFNNYIISPFLPSSYCKKKHFIFPEGGSQTRSSAAYILMAAQQVTKTKDISNQPSNQIGDKDLSNQPSKSLRRVPPRQSVRASWCQSLRWR